MRAEQKFADTIFSWRTAEKNSACQVADAAIATWRDIAMALSPLIGHRGVAALFKRSIYLSKTIHPALDILHDAPIRPGEFNVLHVVLAKESVDEAILINSTLLNAFYDLINSLIGELITQQLLHSVINRPSSGDPAQDVLS